MMFVGKEVLGYSPDAANRKELLQLTADRMLSRQIPFYMIEAQNQLQYDTQDGMYDLAGLMHYNTGRVYAMTKEELEKIDPEEASMRFISAIWNAMCASIFIRFTKSHAMDRRFSIRTCIISRQLVKNFKPEDTRCEKRLSYPYIIQIASFLPLQPQGQLVVLYSS